MKENHISDSSVFKEGGVFEREVAKPKEISQIKRSGIASMPSSWRGKSLGSQRSICPSRIIQKDIKVGEHISDSLKPADASYQEMQQINDSNLKQIMQMSPKELKEAEREIAAMFSPKNFDFLKKISLQKLATVNPTDSTDTNEDKGSNTRDRKDKYVQNDGLGMVTTIEELKGIQERATKKQRANFAWAIDDSIEANIDDTIIDNQNDSGIDQKKKKRVTLKLGSKPVVSSRFLMRSSSDRFDLKGCKVIEKLSTVNEISDALTENVYLKKFLLSKENIHSIATAYVEEMLSVGFAVQHTPLDGKCNENCAMIQYDISRKN